MHNLIVTSTIIIAGVAGTTSAQALIFSGFPSSGTYQNIASFNLDSESICSMTPYTYNSQLQPLDEEYSAIFRGPIKLKQFAVYALDNGTDSSNKKRDRIHKSDRHGHSHDYLHDRNEDRQEVNQGMEKRGCGAFVTATIDNKVDFMADTWNCNTSPAAAAGTPSPAIASSSILLPAPAPNINAGANNWGRVGYYEASTATSQGLAFLANNQWNTAAYTQLGAVLGYVTSNGTNSTSSPAILEDCLVPDNTEFIISSSTSCVTGDSCGVTAPGATAFHGWGGENKMFMAEFQMPRSFQTGYRNADMPAFWLLNSKIVNTQQYANCSCWASGCGEWDILEVLSNDLTTGYASLHMGCNYGVTAEQNGIARPTNGTIIMVAIVSSQGVAHVRVLDDSTAFGTTVAGSTVTAWLDQNSNADIIVNAPLVPPDC